MKLIVLADNEAAFLKMLSTAFAELMSSHPPAEEPEQLLTMADACKEFGITKTTLTEWKKNGIVPFIRLGRRIYFERSRVLEAGRSHTKYKRHK